MNNNSIKMEEKNIKSTVLTERIKGKGTNVYCSCCWHEMFPKKIIFRTTKNNGITLYNYIGKNGMGCFWQCGCRIFCKKCFSQYSHILQDMRFQN